MRSPKNDFSKYASQICSSEENEITIDRSASFSIALVFPNSYEVGIANLGFQTIYRLFNQITGVVCERVFLYPAFPNETRTLESGRELRKFDIVAFSLSYELDYPRVAQILLNAGLSPFATERHSHDPLIICGGITTFINPEPMAPFMDAILVGEGEELGSEFVQSYIDCQQKGLDKKESLRQLSHIEGVYTPQFYSPPKKIKTRSVRNLDLYPIYSSIITPRGHFQRMFLVEVGRGCGRGCRFCAASHVYHPFRLRSARSILSTIENHISNTRKVGLVGAALSDFKNLESLCENLVNQGYQLGLSSFRMDTMTEKLVNSLEKGNVKTISLAPEAGSERLRRIIKKDLSDEELLGSIELLTKSKIANIKLYFMIGLPFEQESDIKSIVHLLKNISSIYRSKPGRRHITVSINAFIPKPFTPFQWCAMADEKTIKQKRKFIENEIRKLKGLSITRKSSRIEILQGMFSLGDQRVGRSIIQKLRQDLTWRKAWKEAGIDYRGIIHREKSFDEPLPWEVIDCSLSKNRLWQEWQKAREIAQAL